MKRTSERILLITDVPPTKKISGASMTLQQVKFLLEEKHNVDIFLVSDAQLKVDVDDSIIDGVNVKKFTKPNEVWSGDNNDIYYKKIDDLKKELHKVIEENEYTKIWGIVQGEVILELIDYCRTNEKVPYVCQIWDSIGWWIRENHFAENRAKKVMKKYYSVIEGACSCITASWNMNNELNKKYKNTYIELMPALELPEITDKDIEKDEDRIVISMSGQIYAKDELDAFLTALDSINWEINSKKVYFYHYGNASRDFVKKHKKYADRIVFKGFVKQDLLLKKMASSDYVYCPYFFSNDPVYKEISVTSFPCKLITYLALPVPTIMHAPKYSSPYGFVEKNKCAYLFNSMDPEKIAKDLLKLKYDKKMISNAKKAFSNNFTPEIIKKKFFKAMDIKYSEENRMRILEVNNIDLSGKRFNGFDLLHEINDNTNHICKQIVTYKESNDHNVVKFYKNQEDLNVEYRLLAAELDILSVHNVLSLTSNILLNHEDFKKADLVHYHLVDNTKLSLCQLDEMVSLKPSVITLHDPWWFTGRCVYPQECEKWKTGCYKCEYMKRLFELPRDNCAELWKLKESIYKNLDADIIVTTPYMTDCIRDCSMTNFENVHVVPFGIDLDAFKPKMSQKEAKKHFGIDDNDMVIFLRAQMASKGTEYVLEAMKLLETDKKITLLTCSETHLLDELKNKYNVVDLGNIKDDVMQIAYTACDMFLMPSRGETFGLMAIEAMASSKPLIVFNNTALPYVSFAPECGVLVENKNAQKLMEAIKMLLDNEDERIRRGKLGRELCEKHYDVNVYNKRIMEVYEKAYNRQKNKKVFNRDTNIDYSKPDVKELIVKLKKVYKRLEFNTKLDKCELFRVKGLNDKDDKNYKINYADEDVKKVIKVFNDFVYSVYSEEFASQSKTPNNNGSNIIGRLKNKYRSRLLKHPLLFNCLKKIYNIARLVYRKTIKKLIRR